MAAATDALRALHLADVAFGKDSRNAGPLLEKAVQLCKRSGCTTSLQYAQALHQLCELTLAQDESEGLHYADEATAVLTAFDEGVETVLTEFASCDYVRGIALTRLGRYGDSLLAHQACLRRYESLCDDSDIITALCNIGDLLVGVGRLEDALHHLRLAEARALESPLAFAPDLEIYYTSIGDAQFKLGRHAEAFDSMQCCKARIVARVGTRSPKLVSVCCNFARALLSLK